VQVDYLEDHGKMRVLRIMAERDPNGMINSVLKTIDEIWDEEIQKKIQKLKLSKKAAFVTKF